VAKDVQYDKHPPSLRRQCTKGTRNQIIEDLMAWARDDNGPNIYWLCGMAGTGKTTIAYSLCERLKAEGRLGASYFCSRTINDSRDIRAVIPSIAYQLASQSVTLRSLIVQAVNKDRELASSQTKIQFTHLIRNPIFSCSDEVAYVLALDAFDEFKTLDDARHLLTTLTTFAPVLPSIKLFITSRQEPQIEEVFKRVKGTLFRLHNVEQSLVRADIERYLYERRAEIRTVKGLDDMWWTNEQLQHLLDSAGKLFIYASTVCSFLETSDAEECERNLEIFFTNHNLTLTMGQYDELDKLYCEVLCAVQQDQHRKDLIHRVLRVVITAVNPLPIQTIASLLKTDTIAVYSALKRLGAVTTVPDNKGSDSVIIPFHVSFPDFLHDHSRSKEHNIPEIEGHHFMLKLCLDILNSSPVLKQNICNLGQSVHVSKIDPASLESIPGDLKYACLHWMVHLEYIITRENLKESVSLLVMTFFDIHILHWIECMALLGKLGDAVHLLQKIELSAMASSHKLTGLPLLTLHRLVRSFAWLQWTLIEL
jgi:hypothetical protein